MTTETVTREHFDATVGELKEMILALRPRPVAQFESTMKPKEVMKLFGYKDRASFWQAVRAANVPFIKLNARRFAFDPAAVKAWKERREFNSVS